MKPNFNIRSSLDYFQGELKLVCLFSHLGTQDLLGAVGEKNKESH